MKPAIKIVLMMFFSALLSLSPEVALSEEPLTCGISDVGIHMGQVDNATPEEMPEVIATGTITCNLKPTVYLRVYFNMGSNPDSNLWRRMQRTIPQGEEKVYYGLYREDGVYLQEFWDGTSNYINIIPDDCFVNCGDSCWQCNFNVIGKVVYWGMPDYYTGSYYDYGVVRLKYFEETD